MRILFLTETFPYPLDSGGRIRTYHTLAILGGRHEVHLHALTRRRVLPDHCRSLELHCASVTVHPQPDGRVPEIRRGLSSLLTGRPYTVMRHVHAHVADALARASATLEPDFVYCDHLSMFEYGRRLEGPALIDAHNVEYRVYARYAALGSQSTGQSALFARESRALERYERRAYVDAEAVLAVSDIDAEAIRTLTGNRACVRMVPIAIDVDSVAPIERLTSAPELLFLGGLHWPANADAAVYFAQRVLPIIRREIPDARLTVVGRDDVEMAARLRRMAGVRLVGTVEDIGPPIQTSRAMVVPLRAGGGTRVKILDAFARGLPVVSTTLGCEGLPIVAGRHALIADAPDEFASHVVRLVRDDRLAIALAEEGRRFVVEHHRVEIVAPDLLDAVAAFPRPPRA